MDTFEEEYKFPHIVGAIDGCHVEINAPLENKEDYFNRKQYYSINLARDIEMVGTKHCCWGQCKTDSRYPEKWPELLKELENSGQKVFIPFPEPAKDLAKCKRWIVACSREFFTEKTVNKNTYICALHCPGAGQLKAQETISN